MSRHGRLLQDSCPDGADGAAPQELGLNGVGGEVSHRGAENTEILLEPALPVRLWRNLGPDFPVARDVPVAGNVAGQYPDSARVRRVRATRQTPFVKGATTKCAKCTKGRGVCGREEVSHRGAENTESFFHGSRHHRHRSESCPSASCPLPPEGGPTAPRAGSSLRPFPVPEAALGARGPVCPAWA
jgi:hypothetical protein